MKIGNVTNSGGNSIIQIVDTAQDKLTEYSSDKTRTIENYSAWLSNNSKGKVTTGAGLAIGQSATYNPKAGLTYRWAQGLDQTTVYHYYKEEVISRWGNKPDPNYTGKYEDMSNTYNETSRDEPKKNPLGEGYQIYNQAQDEVLRLYAQNKVDSTSYGIDRPAYRTKSGFAGYYHHWHHFWNKKVGTTQTYLYSLKADYPVSVELIGKDNPTINLFNTATAGGDLYLSGNIRNDNATLNIRANGGKIEQEGVKIYTDNINLNARTGIKNIDITNHRKDDLKLNARTTAGDIDVNVTGSNVIVDALRSEYGGVTLKAQGDIKQTQSGASVNAQNIKLDSLNGSINLKLESPSLTPNS